MGQSEKEKKAPQPVVVVAVAMIKEVELEAFGHERVLEERDLLFWKRKEAWRMFLKVQLVYKTL